MQVELWQERRQLGGERTIGRRLHRILDRGGLVEVSLRPYCARSDMLGLDAFAMLLGPEQFARGTRDDGGVGLLARDDSVLVVVDVQPGFLAREWFSEQDLAAAETALERAVWLVALAARLGIPVVVTEEEPERNGPTDSRLTERLPAGAPVLRKPTFGLAGTPEILAAVRASGRGTAVLVGCETDVCVAQSAIGLRGEGLGCIVVADATFSPGEMHARGLERLASAGVERNHAKGVAYEWLRSVDAARAALGDPSLPAPPFRL